MAQLVMTASNGTRTLRFDLGTSCGPRALDIASVRLPAPESAYAGLSSEQFRAIGTAVKQAVGAVPGPHNYLVFVDVACSNDVGGRGDTPVDEAPGPTNVANQPSDVSESRVAEVLHCGSEEYFSGPGEQNTFLPLSPLHEIGHNLGAVQNGAPHASRNGHCWDRADVMCYDDEGPGIPPGAFAGPLQCPGTPFAPFDCGGDDYFNVAPPPGSYLAGHWNIANSAFMCVPAQCYAPVGVPAAGIAIDQAIIPTGRTLQMTAGASSTNGAITEYRWDYDPRPGDEVVSTTPTATAVFATRGVVPIRLTVRDVFGQHGVSQGSVRVVGQPPTVGAGTPGRVVVGRSVALSGSATAGEGQTLVRRGWDTTGDGVIDVNGNVIRRNYRRRVTTRLRFIAIDDVGQTSFTDRSIVVSRAPAMRLRLNTTSRRALRRRALRVTIGRPPAGRLNITASVGFWRAGVFRPTVNLHRRTNTRADVNKVVILKLGLRAQRALRRPRAGLRVRVTAPGFDIARSVRSVRLKR